VRRKAQIPGFAPDAPGDGRDLLDWRSRYPDPEAKRCIRFEAWYLALHLYAGALGIASLWLLSNIHPAFLAAPQWVTIAKYGIAWCSGILGGTLFALKWLYHSVARQLWHQDRRLWRLLTPHISGALSFAVVALISSGLLRVFDRQAFDSYSVVAGMGFMVGYFSDNAAAKLTDLAETLFGATRTQGQRIDDKSTAVPAIGQAEAGAVSSDTASGLPASSEEPPQELG
jgi:hypothetical protein